MYLIHISWIKAECYWNLNPTFGTDGTFNLSRFDDDNDEDDDADDNDAVAADDDD